MAKKAKKLYFDLTVLAGDSSIVKLTEENDTTPGDRYGNLLDIYPAATSVTPASVRQRAEITAFFVPRKALDTVVAGLVSVTFVDSSNSLSPALAPTPTGVSGVTLQNPCVRVNFAGGSGSLVGTLYIQRQHSIEA
jgi:hypothetical protein